MNQQFIKSNLIKSMLSNNVPSRFILISLRFMFVGFYYIYFVDEFTNKGKKKRSFII